MICSIIFHVQHIQFLSLLFLEKHLQYFSTQREEQDFGHWVGVFSKTTNCMLFILPYWTWQLFQYICDINHGTFPYCKILFGFHCDLMKSASSSLCNMWIHCSANGTLMEIFSLSDWHYYPLCRFVIWIFRLLRSTRWMGMLVNSTCELLIVFNLFCKFPQQSDCSAMKSKMSKCVPSNFPPSWRMIVVSMKDYLHITNMKSNMSCIEVRNWSSALTRYKNTQLQCQWS